MEKFVNFFLTFCELIVGRTPSPPSFTCRHFCFMPLPKFGFSDDLTIRSVLFLVLSLYFRDISLRISATRTFPQSFTLLLSWILASWHLTSKWSEDFSLWRSNWLKWSPFSSRRKIVPAIRVTFWRAFKFCSFSIQRGRQNIPLSGCRPNAWRSLAAFLVDSSEFYTKFLFGCHFGLRYRCAIKFSAFPTADLLF